MKRTIIIFLSLFTLTACGGRPGSSSGGRYAGNGAPITGATVAGDAAQALKGMATTFGLEVLARMLTETAASMSKAY